MENSSSLLGSGRRDAPEGALRPTLNASGQDPDLLLGLYRRRHGDNASRLLIEETALPLIDALVGKGELGFRDAWDALQQELSPARGPEELAALSMRSVLDDAAGYLDAAEELVGIDLTLLDPSFDGDREALAIRRAFLEAEVNRFESDHPSDVAA